ncbi:MAG TPA: HEAT repeat domain-containing protein [Ktedonobacteraceae bacterium]|nr:HEAT repeat domain-containing protein [Ktedonobacteraceae bacterium]
MRQAQRPVSSPGTRRGSTSRSPRQRSNQPVLHTIPSRVFHALLAGLLVAVVLSLLEGGIWLLIRRANVAALFSLLAHTPLIWLLLVAQAVIVIVLALLLARPLALRRYIAATQKHLEQVRAATTPLSSWASLYETPLTYFQDTPDPLNPVQVQSLSLPELLQLFQSDLPTHALILGEPGMGRTTALLAYQYGLLQQRRSLLSGRRLLPIVLPLRLYSLYRANHAAPDTVTLFDFLANSGLPGLHYLRPYLGKLVRQGRLLLLCDGLDEVEEAHRPEIAAQLAALFDTQRNRLVLTCRESDYRQQAAIAEAAVANLVPRAVLEPVTLEGLRSFVERYIEERDSGAQWRHTAGQIMDVLHSTRLRMLCGNLLIFFSFMEIIDAIGVDEGKQLDTRGRLLRAWLQRRIRNVASPALADEDIIAFLGELAWDMRQENGSEAIQLHDDAHLLADIYPSIEIMAETLQIWLDSQTGNGERGLNREEVVFLLQSAQKATLLEIRPHGVISFRHPYISACFAALYLLDLQKRANESPEQTAARLTGLLMRRDIPDAYERWSLPIALWSGLLDDPLAFADSLVAFGQDHPPQALAALSLALLCLGVAWMPPQSGIRIRVPESVRDAMTNVVSSASTCSALARLCIRCAEGGGQEIYHALIPLLPVPGIDAFIARLDAKVVPDLLFNYLLAIIEDGAYEAEVKLLIRVLGRFGEVVVPRATELALPLPSNSGRLRSAAINILGRTDTRSAVEPLIDSLSDSQEFFVRRASSALVHLGPDIALERILEELEYTSATPAGKDIHAALLNILERFLNEQNPARQLSEAQHQQVMNGLMRVLTNSDYAAADKQKARDLLVQQGRTAEESSSGELAVDLLVQNLASSDDSVARSATRTLRDIGNAATTRLLKQLDQSPNETTSVRLVDVLRQIRDPRAIPYLLRLLAHPSLAVQQQAARALRDFAPESIPGLIDRVLHSNDDLAATNAEQVLGDIGEPVVEPTIQALGQIQPGRTLLLVRVLERVHDARAIPALIDLLQIAQQPPVDSTLVLAIISALGHFREERVVPPLLDMLAGSNPVFYEGAINALGSLEDVVADRLIAALNEEQETPFISRIERVFLAMEHFPGEKLLQTFAHGSEAQVQHVRHIFLEKGVDAANFLVKYLIYPDRSIQLNVRQVVGSMPGQIIVPALLDIMDHPEASWRSVIAELLLKHPPEAIPPLVGLLDDNERGGFARDLLVEFGFQALPELIPALDSLNNRAQERARSIILELVRQSPEDVTQVVQLFSLAPPPPQRAHDTLIDLLSNQLADVSIPALLAGLEDVHLVNAVSEALVRLAHNGDERATEVMQALIGALRNDARRYGASRALIEVGPKAVVPVGNLITDPDPQVAQAAQNILCEIGVPAFPFIWAAHSDVHNAARREAARTIFRRMPTGTIKDELVQLLSSDEPDKLSMALALLLERIHDEALQQGGAHEMIPVLLEYVQEHGEERASLRIIALLLLLGGRIVIDFLAQTLYDYPNHREILLYAFLLLGEDAEETLLEILHNAEAAPQLRAEAGGMLGLRAPYVDIRELARMISEYGLWAGQAQGIAGVLLADQLNISLRSLGGLLAGGHWNAAELQNMRMMTREGSPERELYEILLGWRYTPYIATLEHEIEMEREEHKRHILDFTQRLSDLQDQKVDLEHEVRRYQQMHTVLDDELKQAKAQIEETRRELNQVQGQLQQAIQERDSYYASWQQASQEYEQSENQRANLQYELQKIRNAINPPDRH